MNHVSFAAKSPSRVTVHVKLCWRFALWCVFLWVGNRWSDPNHWLPLGKSAITKESNLESLGKLITRIRWELITYPQHKIECKWKLCICYVTYFMMSRKRYHCPMFSIKFYVACFYTMPSIQNSIELNWDMTSSKFIFIFLWPREFGIYTAMVWFLFTVF